MNNIISRICLCIPTYNADDKWEQVLISIRAQSLQPDILLIIDSGSANGTLSIAENFNPTIIRIDKNEFDHGGTRQIPIDIYEDIDIYAYLTQDAIIASNDSLANLIRSFDDPEVGMSYGRQLPHRNARVLEAHARLFNYPPNSCIKAFSDIPKLGVKTISCSDSFAAYRSSAIKEVGGFPRKTIMGEDVLVAGRMIFSGWKIAYNADAMVYHSHSYTPMEELRRYFDIGVLHASNHYIFEKLGNANSEGLKYVYSEIKYVFSRNPILLPSMFFSIMAKWIGFKLGFSFQKLSKKSRLYLSMNKSYWK